MFIILIFLLTGCAALTPQSYSPPARIGLKLAPATFGGSLSVQQHLTVQRNNRKNELDTILEIDPQQLILVGLTLGQRVMTLYYNGNLLQIWRHPKLPAQLRGEDVLEDMQLTLWPIEAIRNVLPAGWFLEEKNLQRTLLLNNKPIMIISYSNQKRWLGKIVLTNLRYHYQLIIQSVAPK